MPAYEACWGGNGRPTNRCSNDLQCTGLASVAGNRAMEAAVPCCAASSMRTVSWHRSRRCATADHLLRHGTGWPRHHPVPGDGLRCFIPGGVGGLLRRRLLAATNLNYVICRCDHRCWLAAPGTGAGDGCGCSRSAGRWADLPSAWAPWWKGYYVGLRFKGAVEIGRRQVC